MKKGPLVGIIILSDIAASALFFWIIIKNQGQGNLFSDPLIYVVMALFLAVPLLVLVFNRMSSSANQTDLLKNGISAAASILQVWDIRWETRDGMALVGLKLRVNLPDGSSYEARTKAPVAPLSLSAYREGMGVMVRCDPRNRSRVVIDPNPAPAASTPAAAEPAPQPLAASQPAVVTHKAGAGLQQWILSTIKSSLPLEYDQIIEMVLTDANQDGTPDIFQNAGLPVGSPPTQQARLEQLDKLRAMGILTQETYDALREKLLAQDGPKGKPV